jgi:hypothetical protein
MKNSGLPPLINVVILLKFCQLWFYKNKKKKKKVSAIKFASQSLPVNSVTQTYGHAVDEAVGSWLSTAAPQVRVRVEHVVFVVDKAALGQVFSQYFGCPCQSSFHQFLHPHNHLWLAQ